MYKIHDLFMAEREGFEPSKGVNPYFLSREALSATQPSLRIILIYKLFISYTLN